MTEPVNLSVGTSDGSAEPTAPVPTQIEVDKMGSATIRLHLPYTLNVLPPNNPVVGDVVVVRTLTDNPSYNKLELVSGRQARIKVGDIIVGVLGRRRALKGFVGDVPKDIKPGEKLHLLNLGGLIGKSTGRFHGLGRPIQVELLGVAVQEDGTPINIKQSALPPIETLDRSAPLILVSGTSMNVGKTQVMAELAKQFARRHYKVAGAKLSGVAALRDTLDMEDHGADHTLSFLDCGYPSTVGVKDLGPVARTILHHLNQHNPDVILVEMGDGLIGGYNVDSIFKHQDITKHIAALVLCASDFVGAWGGLKILEQHNMRVDVISGPCTDSQMGIDLLKKKFDAKGANAINQGDVLFGLIEECIKAYQNTPA